MTHMGMQTYWNCGIDSSCFSTRSLPSCMSILRHPPDRCWCIGPCIENVSACGHISALHTQLAQRTHHLGDEWLASEAALDVLLCEHILWLVEPGSGGIEVGISCHAVSSIPCIAGRTCQSRRGYGGRSSRPAGQSSPPLQGGEAGGVVCGGASWAGSWAAASLGGGGRTG